MSIRIELGDALNLPLADDSVDLVLGSPPYCDARTYGIGFKLKCQPWIEFMLKATEEALRVCRGQIVWIVAGVTRGRQYWPAPEGLLYECFKREWFVDAPVFWHKNGISGSGSTQGFRRDVEYCLMIRKCKVLPWRDCLAFGKPPKRAPGGEMSHRTQNGQRVNDLFVSHGRGTEGGRGGRIKPKRSKAEVVKKRRGPNGHANGDMIQENSYHPPALANPGNLLSVKVGGGLMGHKLAHENEAPFPEGVAEFFIRSFCPQDGTVLDPFCGSGTTLATAERCRRNSVGFDIRQSQVDLSFLRCQDIPVELF